MWDLQSQIRKDGASMLKQIKPAILMTFVLTVLTGLLYPLAVTALAKWLFRHQAAGSLVMNNGRVVGSELIGQRFTNPRYFHGRPSAAGDAGYNANSSGGSNLGPTSAKLADRVRQTAKELKTENPSADVAVDLVTTSGSGLDPDISPAAAAFQIPRVAAARGMPQVDLRNLVEKHTRDRQLGVLGERRVNVLELNMALDAAAGLDAR
jgi:K+-transporting ATPase ATPase C chain